MEVPFFFVAGDEEVFRLGDFDFLAAVFAFPFFGFGEAEVDLERDFEPDFALGLGEAEAFFFVLGLGEAEAFFGLGEEDSFFSVFFS